MPDMSALANAIVNKLGADAALLALMPNGVYMDVGPVNATRFVTVTLVVGFTIATFGKGRTIVDQEFLVQAVALSAGGSSVQAAAARIDELLEDGTLVVPGYGVMALFCEEPIRFTEVDQADASIRWFHRGGRYRLQAALA